MEIGKYVFEKTMKKSPMGEIMPLKFSLPTKLHFETPTKWNLKVRLCNL